ncbi:esterase/lipase family protein [Thiocystis violacea]|uniref:esterase/lipase family protein n=1 Tax=Thiocystis violacea TaxID=13725 RepID=UPI0019039694|nr:alpha/beta hydrolase [Thiocystis violacea]MBK1718675.1 alpha/beta hydrolase [Thiocystis violacea]
MTAASLAFNPWLNALAPFRLALEGRAGWEFAAMLAAQPLLAQVPRGDGHPVLVLPRFLGCDLSTQPLRDYLTGIGHPAHAWDLGVNLGPRDGVMAACLSRLDELRARHGRKVSLIGWSLGGLFARELAKEAPDQVRMVITLGTPFAGDASPSEVWRLYEGVTGDHMGLSRRHGSLEQSPPVPTTSIFSRSDGIVAWPGSLEHEGPQCENIEVESSHLGLAVNPLSLYAIADRLAQPENDWRPFERQGLRAWFYPDPRRPGWF